MARCRARREFEISTWERGPFGDYVPEGTIKAAAEATTQYAPENRHQVEIIIRGPAKSGKTTLANMILHLLKQRALTVSLNDGTDVPQGEALNHPYHAFGRTSNITIRTEATVREHPCTLDLKDSGYGEATAPAKGT